MIAPCILVIHPAVCSSATHTHMLRRLALLLQEHGRAWRCTKYGSPLHTFVIHTAVCSSGTHIHTHTCSGAWPSFHRNTGGPGGAPGAGGWGAGTADVAMISATHPCTLQKRVQARLERHKSYRYALPQGTGQRKGF